jgi:hypothetical protein
MIPTAITAVINPVNQSVISIFTLAQSVQLGKKTKGRHKRHQSEKYQCKFATTANIKTLVSH